MDAANAVALETAIARTRRALYVGVLVDGAAGADGRGGYDDGRAAVGVLRVYEAAFDAQACRRRLGVEVVVGPVAASAGGVVGSRAALVLPGVGAVFVAGASAPEWLTAAAAARAAASLPPLMLVSYAPALAKRRLDEPHVYFEDAAAAGAPLPAYDHVVMGGTFDCFHVGHRRLLTVAAYVARRRLVIGMTSDAMAAAKTARAGPGAVPMEPLGKRAAAVAAFLSWLRPDLRVELHPIDDAFGPSVVDGALQAIVVSSETLAGGAAVNEERRARGLATLAVVATARSNAATMSSTFLRARKREDAAGAAV